MTPMERCPACRARLAGAAICPRCGADYSTTRRAERQAQHQACLAVRELCLGRVEQAGSAAAAAIQLADSPLAQAVRATLQQWETGQNEAQKTKTRLSLARLKAVRKDARKQPWLKRLKPTQRTHHQP